VPAAARRGGVSVRTTAVRDPRAVARAQAERCSEAELAALSDTFQILASPVRLRIVHALSQRELCVCDLARVVDASVSAVSHHLRQLRQMRLVRCRRRGRMAYYRLDDEHVAKLFAMGLEHVREELGERGHGRRA
jgi:DNA-binding transcriptional ArsR family regulator